jgi:hypothetical protein
MTFDTIVLQTGNNTGIVVPDEIVASLGAAKKPKVIVTLARHSYRSSIGNMGGRFLIPLSAANRAAAGVTGGVAVTVGLELDEAPRTVDLPAELAAVLAERPEIEAAFLALSYSNQLRHALSVADAKTAETRSRRIDKVIAAFDAKA